jgi:hypothetical protein
MLLLTVSQQVNLSIFSLVLANRLSRDTSRPRDTIYSILHVAISTNINLIKILHLPLRQLLHSLVGNVINA